jgi:predicted lipoprotein with Yx(FWY)xxD motif
MMIRELGANMNSKPHTPHQEDREMSQKKFQTGAGRRITHGRLVGAILAACGLSAALVATGAPAGAATRVVVSTTKNATYGTILVSGKTVYTLKASNVSCGPNCLKVWPELVLPKGVTHATAGSGVNAAKLGTVKRSGGVLQVTYNGKALYWFFLDRSPGQVKGNLKDKWGTWSVVVTAKPAGSSSGATTTTGGSSAGTGGVSF